MYNDKAYRQAQRARTDEHMLRKVMQSAAAGQRQRVSDHRDTGRTPNCRGDYPTYGIEEAPSLAMVFAPIQVWRKLYDPETGLGRGTIFTELDKPWEIVENARGGGRRGN